MTETERIRRVREMERRMHELSAAAEGLQTALAAYEAALPARRALEDYYESPLWQEDFAADEADRTAWHIWLQDEGGIAAYARVLAPGTVFPDVSIGRVTAVRRREGLGRRIVLAAIGAAKKHFGARRITIEAQSYVKTLYTALGFTQTGPEFLEDGIPHVPMQLQL